ncbi:hypothetical protein CONPUDRAFT_80795 [Coniophora puteana RWD-64-598 SS2]|uniref:Uncharacterized protein n=1 Tax=Coniophora puteana (strain RWD-64-598) TaxID=741705 RepID=A0A5M3MZ89_CONPW|nr:uncharacterized protein CONPUDRAFT_80795 [Coniophora puteana RWD-64-598 SS2]EIW84462.1 hypothetical protein CONPUDRAFT_80795 [Coniophora puteana RWD-64-598 SS2]
MDPAPRSPTLTPGNVAIAGAFVAFTVVVSTVLKLGVGGTLLTAAIRCIIQLSVMGFFLQKIFETNNPWAVAGIAMLLNLLGTFEAVTNKSKKRHDFMFFSVLLGMLSSTIPVSILGSRFAMSSEPFWKPEQYIPIVGMLCGNAISGVVVAVSYVLKELYENRDKIETYLAFGASRFEACTPLAQEALRLALTPTMNQMSVIGLISIPGMMTGAILGGSSVEQAAKLQIIIMFMLSASTALASIVATVMALHVVVDKEHRVRLDRVDVRDHAIWRARAWLVGKVIGVLRALVEPVTRMLKRRGGDRWDDGIGGESGILLS